MLLQFLSVFDVITIQIILLNTYQITILVKWVCLHWTIDVSCAH